MVCTAWFDQRKRVNYAKETARRVPFARRFSAREASLERARVVIVLGNGKQSEVSALILRRHSPSSQCL